MSSMETCDNCGIGYRMSCHDAPYPPRTWTSVQRAGAFPMAVYVDDMYRFPMGQLGRMRMSHMIADTEEELHEMADAIGIARRWYQGDHYDISISRRNLAVARGAIPVPLKVLARMRSTRRRIGHLPTPEEAAAEMLRPLPIHIRLMIGPVVIKRSKT